MKIAMLHTAQVHADTFDAIFADLAPDLELRHHVAEDLLERARAAGLDPIRPDMQRLLSDLAQADAVICTCSTIGPLAQEFGTTAPHVLRIDQPMMQLACENGPRILVAICLESTRVPTMTLLEQTATAMQAEITPEVLFCADVWPLFEAEEFSTFSVAVAEQIKARVALGGVDCVILAQASMRGAEDHLGDLGVPVFSSPVSAAQRALYIAKGSD